MFLLTMAIAVFCVVLMNDNPWLRAALMTSAAGITLNAMIAMILARGERQAFSIGFVVGTVFFYLGAYGYEFMLPYLITVRLHELMKEIVVSMPDDDHFFLVMGTFWFLMTTFASGAIACRWYRSVQAAGHPHEKSQSTD